MRTYTFGIVVALLVSIALPAIASETEGTISHSDKYAWGENMGWINFAPTNGGLTITKDAITGYAWSPLAGWINFNPVGSGQGVRNTAEGDLSGSAWVAGLGWLAMDGVAIDTSGQFTGVAGEEGSAVGRINFDCTNCSVRTDWRPASVPDTDEEESSSGGGSTGGSASTNRAALPEEIPSGELPVVQEDTLPPASTNTLDPIADFFRDVLDRTPVLRAGEDHVESYNQPLLVGPSQTGLLLWQFEDGVGVIIEVPRGAHTEEVVFLVSLHKTADAKGDTFVVGGVIFDITATALDGFSVDAFLLPLTITFVLGEQLEERSNIGVYWHDDGQQKWIAVPDVLFNGRTAIFSVSHFTRFAVLTGEKPVNSFVVWYGAGSLFLVGMVVVFYRRWFKKRGTQVGIH